MVPRETGKNAYENFWRQSKNIMVFLIWLILLFHVNAMLKPLFSYQSRDLNSVASVTI